MKNVKKNLAVLVLLVISALLTGRANAAILLGSHTSERGPFQAYFEELITVAPFFGDALPDEAGATTYSPFGSIYVDEGTINTPHFTHSAHPDFGGAVAFLTNGNDDLVGDTIFAFGSNSSSGVTESTVLSGSGFTDPDFDGCVITSMIFKLTDFVDFVDYGGVGSTNWYGLEYEVRYFGDPVPIPASVWLLGSGLVGLIAIRRKLKT